MVKIIKNWIIIILGILSMCGVVSSNTYASRCRGKNRSGLSIFYCYHNKKYIKYHNYHFRKHVHLPYYLQGKKLGKYIHNYKDDNYGGVRYLIHNKRILNRKFSNGYYKGYITADPGDDENPVPRVMASIKTARLYLLSNNKFFKKGINDSFKNDFYGRVNRKYSNNKKYKQGLLYFTRTVEKKSPKEKIGNEIYYSTN